MTQEMPGGQPKVISDPHVDAESGGALLPITALETERINILLVDDEPKNLTALETVLDDPGYRLVRAGSANEALLALVAEDFALLVLDIQMPDMNGFELAQMVKQRKKTASIPIIFLTAYFSEDEHVMEGYSSGAVDYLHKPINASVLRSKVAVFAMLHRKTRQSEFANRALQAEIAERHKAQEQLRQLNSDLERRVAARTTELTESEARFRALAEDMPHLVWETDPRGIGTFLNLKWRSYTGLGRLTPEDWNIVVHPQDAPAMIAAWKMSLETGAECDTYCRCHRVADGAYRWFRVKAAPVRNAAGDIVRWVGTCTDVHEQRKAEEALVEADKRKDEFLAMLGHELRNPLAAIRHAVRIHEEDACEDPAAHQWASGVIDRQTAQLARMVDDLLDVERINRGRIELRLEPVEIDALLGRAADSIRSTMEQKGHDFTCQVINPGMRVRGDAARLEQVFANLLGNAAKYTPEHGRISLDARRESGEVAISVTDNGVGISPALMPHVFDLFTQGETSLDRAQGGLGIGLTVVKALTEMHGGRVTVESSGGGRAITGATGTTFTIRLPLLAEPGTNHAVPQAEASQELPAALRVLIVDDHVDAAQALGMLLSRRNCEVRVTHDGPAGIITAKEFKPEVLLLDLGLPGLDGYEIARTLRAEPGFRDALFIAISGYAQDVDRARSMAAGFNHHCPKPVDFPALLTIISAKFSNARS
jgi:PAS domain S-box-containing protein